MRRATPICVATLGLLALSAVVDCGGVDVPVITALTPETHTPNFPIAGTQGPHAGLTCDTCHGGTSSFRQFSCSNGTCHPQAEADAQHLNRLGYEFYGPSCYGCHPTGVKEGALDHAKLFPIANGQIHGWINCNGCHQNPDTRKEVSCAIEGCHGQTPTKAQHPNVADYIWTTAACLSCHPNGIIPPS